MTTWHQQRAMARMKVKLWHPTHFTVVEDSPLGPLCTIRFESLAKAEKYLDNIKRHGRDGYILYPESLPPKEV